MLKPLLFKLWRLQENQGTTSHFDDKARLSHCMRQVAQTAALLVNAASSAIGFIHNRVSPSETYRSYLQPHTDVVNQAEAEDGRTTLVLDNHLLAFRAFLGRNYGSQHRSRSDIYCGYGAANVSRNPRGSRAAA